MDIIIIEHNACKASVNNTKSVIEHFNGALYGCDLHTQTNRCSDGGVSPVKPIDIKLLNCEDINLLFTQTPEDGWMAASFGVFIFAANLKLLAQLDAVARIIS